MQNRMRRHCTQISVKIAQLLPEKQFLFLSKGRVRSIKIGTGEQFMGIASASMIAGWLAVSSLTGIGNTTQTARTEAELAQMTAQVQALKADRDVLQGSVAQTAERIEARQQFLDALLTGKAQDGQLAELLPPAARASAEQAAVQGVLAPFAALEKKQNALVNQASASAEARLNDARALIGRLGLRPERFLAQSATQAQRGNRTKLASGGPFVAASETGTDPRFTELYVSWQRLRQFETAMQSLPAFVPLRNYALTSRYGFRSDPFNGRNASHTGLDMAAPTGEDVFAATQGKVVRAGYFGGYGNCIDIDHGHGILTRYGHLSKINVRVGQAVSIGEKIGQVGSTGRSTGPHLHYEVRIDNQPVNPTRFIELSSYLLKFKQSQIGPQLSMLP